MDDIGDQLQRTPPPGAVTIVPKSTVPGAGWFAELRDPLGCVFELWQNQPRAAAG